MIVDRAREVADTVLFPRALEVDAAELVPQSHLDLFAAEGYYGLALDPDVDFPTAMDVLAELAGGDLTTTFILIQHMTLLFAAAQHDRPELLADLLSGRRRSGIGLAGIRNREHPVRLRRSGTGYLLSGTIPWVTGWGRIDTLYVAAREDDTVHFLMIDAEPSDAVTVVRQRLVAVNASGTVNLTIHDLPVSADQVIVSQPYADWQTGDVFGSMTNGYLSIGVATRCARLIGETPLHEEIAAARDALHRAEGETIPHARAQASELAMRAASALAVSVGARAVLLDQHAQRLIREAAFLLVFGSRPVIKDALLHRLRAA